MNGIVNGKLTKSLSDIIPDFANKYSLGAIDITSGEQIDTSQYRFAIQPNRSSSSSWDRISIYFLQAGYAVGVTLKNYYFMSAIFFMPDSNGLVKPDTLNYDDPLVFDTINHTLTSSSSTIIVIW